MDPVRACGLLVQSSSYARIYNDQSDYLRGWGVVNLGTSIVNKTGLAIRCVREKRGRYAAIVNSYLLDAATGLAQSSFTIDPRLFGARVTKRF